MVMKTVKNPSNSDIIDYPVSEAQVDASGNLMYDRDGKMLITVRTLTWTIKAGETVKFPSYVADYLLSVYEFLEPVEEEKKEEEEPKGDGVCKICGKTFKTPRAMALHWAARHPELLK